MRRDDGSGRAAPRGIIVRVEISPSEKRSIGTTIHAEADRSDHRARHSFGANLTPAGRAWLCALMCVAMLVIAVVFGRIAWRDGSPAVRDAAIAGYLAALWLGVVSGLRTRSQLRNAPMSPADVAARLELRRRKSRPWVWGGVALSVVLINSPAGRGEGFHLGIALLAAYCVPSFAILVVAWVERRRTSNMSRRAHTDA